ncbi:FecR family protein [Sphingobacterium sp. LRF_L2]|uniref:FecR family protein n=1 Tax=Sphingobacterium sp. LRF_L2 TaxID=3369421 RepID=UPI003F63B78D
MPSHEDFEMLDFLADSDFKEWVLYQTNAPYWNTFIQDNPHKAECIKEAKEFILTMATPLQQSHNAIKRANWDTIESAISSPADDKKIIKRFPNNKMILRIAACLIPLCMLFAYLHYYGRTTSAAALEYKNEYGRRTEITLPDSSSIVLVGKATLRTKKSWHKEEQREVWLEGNAYFKVKHLHQKGTKVHPSDQFIVHTNQNGHVEVLGTTFHINSQYQQVSIYLESGSVRVTKDHQTALLKPGEEVTLSDAGFQLKEKPAFVANWQQQELTLQKTPLFEVLRINREVFGNQIMLPTSVDTTQLLDGVLPFSSQNQLLKSLSTLLDKEVHTQSTDLSTP